MTPAEKLRYISRFGKLFQNGEGWKFVRFPDCDCPVIELSGSSKWAVVERVYDMIVEFKK